MRRLILALVGSAACISAVATPTCPDDFTYDCLFCDKVPLTVWYDCCMTPASGWCCTCFCRNIKCELLWFECPPLEGDGVERDYTTLNGPDYACVQPQGLCLPIP
jgi:hypothetical protein